MSLRLIFLVDDSRWLLYDLLHGWTAETREHDVPMELEFAKPELEQLVTDDSAAGSYGAAVVKGYRKVVNFIKAANDERDFWSMRSLNFEKLKGDRQHQHSMRINKQWRLILEIKSGDPKNTIVILEIENHYR